MRQFRIKGRALLLFIIYTFSILAASTTNRINRDENTVLTIAGGISLSSERETTLLKSDDYKIASRIFELFTSGKEDKKRAKMLIPSGDVFGIRLKEEYVSVQSAEDGSPFKCGDKILAISENNIASIEDVTSVLANFGGGRLSVSILRGGERMTLNIIPKHENGEYKLGVTLRESACGIGTITFIDPETKLFGGLGHGVYDSEQNPIEIKVGEATTALLGSITRGEAGKPGELSGMLTKTKIGNIYKNNECGVFGTLDTYKTTDTPIPVANKLEIKSGSAEIISTVKNGKKMAYDIEISNVNLAASGSKCFKIKVTDPALIAMTGGIVRGMSGSPIIQDGKLVGAVTHVLVANPTEGYGIFIENMLSAANEQIQPKAA